MRYYITANLFIPCIENKVSAIKLIRGATNAGLKQSKELVEHAAGVYPFGVKLLLTAAQYGDLIAGIHEYSEGMHLAITHVRRKDASDVAYDFATK